MVISSVVFDGGFHQVHQDSSAELVITGSGLDGVTDVTFDGRFVARLVSRTAAEVRFTVFVSFGVTGPRDVTVVSPSESVTVPEAIEITPWVFGPGAAPGGRGTFESPLALAEYSSGAGHGDTLLFLPGEHRSDGTASVDGSAIIAGQGSATTVIRGDTGGFGGFRLFSFLAQRDTVAVRGLTIRSAPGATALYSSDGGLDVEDVVLIGGGIDLVGSTDASSPVSIRRLTHDGQGGGGTGIRAQWFNNVTVSDSSFSSCDTGMTFEAGDFAITRTLVQGCARGIWAVARRRGTFGFEFLGGQVTDSQFVDSGIGIAVASPQDIVTVSGVTIEDPDATPAASQRGIVAFMGSLVVSQTIITGQDLSGVEMRADPGPGFDQGTSIFLREVSIAGGQIGVHANGFPDDNQLSMRDCVVKDQTIASVRFDNDQSLFNFGNDGAGGNQLSVVSGVALEDLRDDPSSDAIPAQGITLNGRSYAGHGRRRGLVEGPIDVSPDYRILAAGRIQF